MRECPVPIKPTDSEEEYFKRQEYVKLRRAREAEAARLSEQQRKQARELHYMKCPKCGMDLQEITYRNVAVDKCLSCGGTWLDEGELKHLKEAEAVGFLASLRRIFK